MKLKDTIMCLSDIRTFQGVENILEEIKPKFIFLLGDILYDGPGQFYKINDKIISENTHSNKFLEKIHTKYFLNFLESCITLGVKKIFIIPGNHDYDVNYNKIILSRILSLNKIVFVQEPLYVNVKHTNIFLLPYQCLRKRKLKSFIPELHNFDILMTHAELRHLRYLVREMYVPDNKNKLIISGHFGFGYFPPKKIEEALAYRKPKIENNDSKESSYFQLNHNKKIHILRIDSFPFSFCSLEISKKIIKGNLLYAKSVLKNSFIEFFIKKRYKLKPYTKHVFLLETFRIKIS